MAELHLLADYKLLSQRHREQFTPILNQLETSVHETLNQLRQQEQALVDAQAKQLAQLHAKLATDARILLDSAELQAFVTEVQAVPVPSHWNQIELDTNPVNWHLNQTHFKLAIRDYKNSVDHDAYDDERTHTTYGYEITLQVGDESNCITVITQRVYSPIEQEINSLREQIYYYVEGEVEKLLQSQNLEDSLLHPLVQETSYLFACAIRLLSLTPQMVQFHYSTLESST